MATGFYRRRGGNYAILRDLCAGVVELADTPDLGSGAERLGGSTPFTRTMLKNFSLLEGPLG